MIPSEVLDMARIMCGPDFDELHPDDQNNYIEDAQKLYDAGYRKQETEG